MALLKFDLQEGQMAIPLSKAHRPSTEVGFNGIRTQDRV